MMKLLKNILWSIVAIPFVLVGAVLFGILRLIITIIDLPIVVLCDIWGKDYDE